MPDPVRFRTSVSLYRQRRGYLQAFVTLTDVSTRQRRYYWLGQYDMPESREAHYRIIAQGEANGRRRPSCDATASTPLLPLVVVDP